MYIDRLNKVAFLPFLQIQTRSIGSGLPPILRTYVCQHFPWQPWHTRKLQQKNNSLCHHKINTHNNRTGPRIGRNNLQSSLLTEELTTEQEITFVLLRLVGCLCINQIQKLSTLSKLVHKLFAIAQKQFFYNILGPKRLRKLLLCYSKKLMNLFYVSGCSNELIPYYYSLSYFMRVIIFQECTLSLKIKNFAISSRTTKDKH